MFASHTPSAINQVVILLGPDVIDLIKYLSYEIELNSQFCLIILLNSLTHLALIDFTKQNLIKYYKTLNLKIKYSKIMKFSKKNFRFKCSSKK